jgi:hypothetical protein
MGMPSLSPPRAEAMREPCAAFEQHAHVVTCPSLLSWGSAALEPGAAHVVRPGARPIPLYRWFLPMGRVALASGGPCEYTVSSAFNGTILCSHRRVPRSGLRSACTAKRHDSCLQPYSAGSRFTATASAIADPRDGGRRFRHVFCHHIYSSHGSSHGRKLVRGHIHNSFQCKNIGTQPLYFSFSKLASAERHPSWFFKLSTRARWALFPFMQPLVPQNAGMTVGWPLIKRNVTNPKPSSGARKRSSSSPSSHTA